MKYNEINKIRLFKEAKAISNALLIWNLPTRKKILGEELAKQANERLIKNNELDGLIIKHLGQGGWQKEKEAIAFYSINEKAARELITETNKQYSFITLLEAKGGKIGELDRILRQIN